MNYNQPTAAAAAGYPLNIETRDLSSENFNTLHSSPLVLIDRVEDSYIVPIFYLLEYDGNNITHNPNMFMGDLAAFQIYNSTGGMCYLDNSVLDKTTGQLYAEITAFSGTPTITFNITPNTDFVLFTNSNISIDFASFKIKIGYYIFPIW